MKLDSGERTVPANSRMEKHYVRRFAERAFEAIRISHIIAKRHIERRIKGHTLILWRCMINIINTDGGIALYIFIPYS